MYRGEGQDGEGPSLSPVWRRALLFAWLLLAIVVVQAGTAMYDMGGFSLDADELFGGAFGAVAHIVTQPLPEWGTAEWAIVVVTLLAAFRIVRSTAR